MSLQDAVEISVPKLIRDLLYAPPAPQEIASLLEVTTVHFAHGQHEVRSSSDRVCFFRPHELLFFPIS
jgi:hypothetical protein